MSISPIVLFFVGAPLVILAYGVRRLLADNRRVRPWLEQQGYRAQSVEMRFLTSGPFENIQLPGTSHGDSLYRVLAQDATGAECVLWVCVPRSGPRPWELRRDSAPEKTRRGLSAPAFAGFVAVLILVVVSGILLLSRQMGR